jgi:hypothetical protein
MARKEVAVILPVFKDGLSDNELLSLKQCLTTLKAYPVFFIGPTKLNTAVYEDICHTHIPFNIKRFENGFFNDIGSYNRLMLSTDFYKSFLDYKFILIHQLDAFVFKDELEYWCRKNYDFIGAPNLPHQNRVNEVQFLKGYSKFIHRFNRIFQTNHKISNVGNGGFSLRKTASCYWMLRMLKNQLDNWGENNEDGFLSIGEIYFILFLNFRPMK